MNIPSESTSLNQESERNEENSLQDTLPDTTSIIPEEVKSILENLSADQQAKVVKAMIAVSRTWRGPMPPPEVLKKYNDCAPNGADRILQMTEKQSDHRMKMEDKAISGEWHQRKPGKSLLSLLQCLFCWFPAY